MCFSQSRPVCAAASCDQVLLHVAVFGYVSCMEMFKPTFVSVLPVQQAKPNTFTHTHRHDCSMPIVQCPWVQSKVYVSTGLHIRSNTSSFLRSADTCSRSTSSPEAHKILRDDMSQEPMGILCPQLWQLMWQCMLLVYILLPSRRSSQTSPSHSLCNCMLLHQHVQQSQDSCWIARHAFATCLLGTMAPWADIWGSELPCSEPQPQCRDPSIAQLHISTGPAWECTAAPVCTACDGPRISASDRCCHAICSSDACHRQSLQGLQMEMSKVQTVLAVAHMPRA